MGDKQTELTGPDLAKGVRADSVADGTTLAGHAFGDPVLLARAGDVFFAVGATCTHYGAPLTVGSSSARPCAAHGTTPASASVRATLCGRRRSAPFHAGPWSGAESWWP